MNTYRLTDEELIELLDASKPVPYMVIGGVEPKSPHENAMAVWRKVANRVGCEVDSIVRGGTDDQHDFRALPKEGKFNDIQLFQALADLEALATILVLQHGCDNHPDDYSEIFKARQLLGKETWDNKPAMKHLYPVDP